MWERNRAWSGNNEQRRWRGPLVAAAALLLCVAAATAYGEVRNPNGVAVVIGNRSYDHERVPEVSYAHRDAAAFKQYVIDVLGFDEENIIELKDASQGNLSTVFGNERGPERTKLWSYLHPSGSDVVVYYSGHGVPGLDDGRGYLLPRDADPNTAEINGYSIDLLYENLRKLEDARSVTVYLDACFSGDSHEGPLVHSASLMSGPQFELPGTATEKVTILTAASGTQLASWDEEAGHGLFTEHLLDALYGGADVDGDGTVTAGEVLEYLSGTMTRAARRTYLRRQEASLSGVPEVVLATAVGGAFPERPMLGADDSAVVTATEERDEVRPVTATAQVSGSRIRDCAECPELVVVPPGTFTMGSEGRQHQVTIPEALAVGVYEVTFREWDECTQRGGCLGYRPDDEGWGRANRPVINVSWQDAQEYVEWLSAYTGKRYRLLSESEWEYVARAGTTTPYSVGDQITTAQANYGEFRGRTVAVGTYPANAFGLHDVHGNVWEWTQDCWNASYAGAPNDGSASAAGDCGRRVLRGGSWGDEPWFLRSAGRYGDTSGDRVDSFGFRVARTLAP